MSQLLQNLIGEIRSLQARATALEERLRTVYDRCESAAATIPDCVALGERGGCVITPWHALGAYHHRHEKGDIIRYRWGEREVDRVQKAGDNTVDIAVYTFDQAVPDFVEPARYLPWDWARHLPTDALGERLRRRLRALGTKAGGSVHESAVYQLGADFSAEARYVVGGDSGQPVWLPLPQPVLIGCWLLAGKGPSVAYHQEAIRRCTVLDEHPAAMLEAVW